MSKSKKAGIVRKVKSKSKSKNLEKTQVIGMCMKCKKKMLMLNAKQVVLKNGRNAMKGECECGTKMFKFI